MKGPQTRQELMNLQHRRTDTEVADVVWPLLERLRSFEVGAPEPQPEESDPLGPDERLDALEVQLDCLLDDVQSLRRIERERPGIRARLWAKWAGR